jgi:hypothetical protein
VKSWQPISNGGKFFVQFAGHILHEDSRGRPVHYRSIENARKAADLLNPLARHNAQMLIAKARKANLAAEPGPAAAEPGPAAIDHINGDSTDNRPENLHAVRAAEHRPAAAERQATS